MHNTSCDVAHYVVVTTTVVLVLLVAGLVVRCMYKRISKRHRRRHRWRSIVRRILFQVCFTLFLPFMSYIFSQTKGKPGVESTRRAEQVILWMLIVELLRKKVSAGIAPASENFTRSMGRYTLLYPVEEVVRMAWIGYLVCAYIHGGAGAVKPFFIILWIIGAATLCKRAICIHFASGTFDLDMNARLISGYMAQLVHNRHRQDDGDHHNNHVRDANVMTACNYAVMGRQEIVDSPWLQDQ
ncbi:hypothetical protein D1007_49333 [Hordeum vulgare]|nr:hypothetical protein D1007_49333 [Hordeum vulgare]